MGFSVAAAFALMMIASLVAFGMVYTVLSTNIKEMNSISNQHEKLKLSVEDTGFRIVQVDANNTSSTTYNLKVILYNDGSTTLKATNFSVLVDGILLKNVTYNVTYFYPLRYMNFTVKDLSGSVGSVHRLEVVSNNGVARFTEYKVS